MAAEFHGWFVLVLHSHIPYVLRHDPMEEEMLFEAAAESYLPLLKCFERLIAEGVSPHVTLSFSPSLTEQLTDPEFKSRFREYCLGKARWAAHDKGAFERENPHMAWLASRWEQFYLETHRRFVEQYGEDLVGAFRALQEAGHVELMTCAATHAYLPITYSDATVRAQVRSAVESHQRHFGSAPRGFWLPECGYRPSYWWQPPFTSHKNDPARYRAGVESILAENGIGYFVIDGHQLQKSWPPDLSKTTFEPYLASGANGHPPVSVLSRDIGLSLQVWRHQVGYPGDGSYLDFHKRHGEGRHRYWKITHVDTDLAHKHLYYPDDAERLRVPEHAGHYKMLIAQSLCNFTRDTGRPGMAVTAFDTELFGHWWFEGPDWLYYVLKWANADPEIRVATGSQALAECPPYNRIGVAESSWGNRFDHSTWVNGDVEWVWERIYHAEHEMGCLARELLKADGQADEKFQRIVRQAGREAFLLMASDWQFMIANWSTRNLAEKRVQEHHSDFDRLKEMAWNQRQGRPVTESEWQFLETCEQRDRLLPDLDARLFAE